jgi:hypothetical protein
MFVIIITFTMYLFLYLFIYSTCIFVALATWVLAFYAFNELDLGFEICNKFSAIYLTIFFETF